MHDSHVEQRDIASFCIDPGLFCPCLDFSESYKAFACVNTSYTLPAPPPPPRSVTRTSSPWATSGLALS